MGGKTEKVDRREEGGGLTENFVKGPVFETETQLRIPPEEMAQYSGEGKMQWVGTYKDLAAEHLQVGPDRIAS